MKTTRTLCGRYAAAERNEAMKGQAPLVRCWSVAVTRSLLLLLALAVTAVAQTKRPNILWISTEDISPDLGCYGDSYAVTPNIDKLAAQGVRYTKAFATAPVCAPSGRKSTRLNSSHLGISYAVFCL